MMLSTKMRLFGLLSLILSRNGFAVIKSKNQLPAVITELSADSKKYLVKDNIKLLKLIETYSTLNHDLTNSKVWKSDNINTKLLRAFRGDRAFVWQLRGIDIPELRYLTSTYYQLVNDQMGLMNKFADDADFGNNLFYVQGKAVSREMLDSSNEINFLERNLKLSRIKDLNVLDIGAGYGRSAHRFTQAFHNIKKYYCTDGVPISAFICDYYITYREISNAQIVEMPLLEKTLAGEKIHLAVNIHSFSECSLTAIDWWIALVAKLDIRYLLVIPNAFEDHGSTLLTNKREDFSFILEKHHYKLLVKEPKYCDPLVQRFGLYPTHYYLFEKASEPC